MARVERLLPNILITGTPGTGKTTHASALVTHPDVVAMSQRLLDEDSRSNDIEGPSCHFRHIEVGAYVAEHKMVESYSDEWDSQIIDEDRFLDSLEGYVEQGGLIVDHHSPLLYPRRFFDLVVCLRTPHGELYDRLEKRGYAQKKIEENNEAEIMAVVWEDCCEGYDPEQCVELWSTTNVEAAGKEAQIASGGASGQVEENVERIVAWIQAWCRDRRTG